MEGPHSKVIGLPHIERLKSLELDDESPHMTIKDKKMTYDVFLRALLYYINVYKVIMPIGTRISPVGIYRQKKSKQIFFRERQVGLNETTSENVFF